MKFCLISDVHCHPLKKDSVENLAKFLNHPLVESADHLFLLGDIFDVMGGNHLEYFKLYDFFFSKLEELENRGKKIYYFEGNHDFHLKRLFLSFKKEKNLKNIFLYPNKAFFSFEGKKFLFSHGDDIELGKPLYKLYRFFIKSYCAGLLADYVVPYFLIDKLGNAASQNSKKKNHNRYHDGEYEKENKELFRKAVEVAYEKENFDYIFLGHAHFQDLWKAPEGFTYGNTGPSFLKKEFLYFEDGKITFHSI